MTKCQMLVCHSSALTTSEIAESPTTSSHQVNATKWLMISQLTLLTNPISSLSQPAKRSTTHPLSMWTTLKTIFLLEEFLTLPTDLPGSILMLSMEDLASRPSSGTLLCSVLQPQENNLSTTTSTLVTQLKSQMRRTSENSPFNPLRKSVNQS